MKIGRRAFVTRSSGFLFSLAPFFTDILSISSLNRQALLGDSRVLIFIHLAGGNDWFNTIVPYKSVAYYQERPNLAIDHTLLLKIDNQLAFHPALTALETAFQKNQVAILLNCGLKGHDLSHHKAIKVAQYLDKFGTGAITWHERFADLRGPSLATEEFPIIHVEPEFYKTASGNGSMQSRERLLFSSLKKSNGYELDLDVHYQNKNQNTDSDGHLEDGFVLAMDAVAELIARNNSTTRIYHVSLGGFDTHENQSPKHDHLLRMLNLGIRSLQSNLSSAGLSNRALIVVGSEFGRSLAENENAGTDHGYVNHALVIGQSVSGGIYGQLSGKNESDPSTDIGYGNLLAALLEDWLKYPSELVLGRQYSVPHIIKT